jgi:hypothetical protein
MDTASVPEIIRTSIAPGRLWKLTDDASSGALSQQSWGIASEELFRRFATNQNGVPNTSNGPPTPRTWSVGDFWRNQKGAKLICTGLGTPGTWRQIMRPRLPPTRAAERFQPAA